MAKPTKVPTWATDANYSNGPEVGTPTKADPGAGVQAEGYIPKTRLPAQVINWWQNLVGQWTSWLDSTFAGGDGEVLEVPAGLSVPGQFMLKGVTVLDTPGSGTYNVPAGVRALRIIAIGGGGAGGGAGAPGNGESSAGAGGGAGGIGVRWITSVAASYAYVVGAGGVGVSGGAGGDGGSTTIADITAGGGGGGGWFAPDSISGAAAFPGGAGGVSGTFDYQMGSNPGGAAFRITSVSVVQGYGGAGPFGRVSTNSPASGFGVGGSGRGAGPEQGPFAGYDGAPGAIIIEEYA